MGNPLRNVVIAVVLFGALASGIASAASVNPYAPARHHSPCLVEHPGAVTFCAAREDRHAIREIKRRARLEVRRTHAHVKIHARPLPWDPVKLDRANHWQRRNLRHLQSMPTWQPSDPVELAQMLAARRGWVGSEWSALYKLWNKESGFQTSDPNSSGCDGIPQACPASKMGCGTRLEDAACQIRWGLDYIASSYGRPSAAWAHSLATDPGGWY